jgi:hypothetical protein
MGNTKSSDTFERVQVASGHVDGEVENARMDVPLKVLFDNSTTRTEAETASLVTVSTLTSGSFTVDDVLSPTSEEPSLRSLACRKWCGKKTYSDLIKDGLAFLNKNDFMGTATRPTVMCFESPSSLNCTESSFHNTGLFRFLDSKTTPTLAASKAMVGPLRYSSMTGDALPTYLKNKAPDLLLEHWIKYIPNHVPPKFVHEISKEAQVYAYLPLEEMTHHVNDPYKHYHLCGKDAIHLMTDKTTKLLANSQDCRPCIVKVNHSMGSRGIFAIFNDEDEAEFEQFLKDHDHPGYVITEYVHIARNLACHFFIHPNREITWFGTNENLRLANGNWSTDSYMIMDQQDYLMSILLPYVLDVCQHFLDLGFWGAVGIDVLFDGSGTGYVVDVNPRVTGTCPALMVAKRLEDQYGMTVGIFRRSGDYAFPGTASELFEQVDKYNEANKGQSEIIIFSSYELSPGCTRVNIGVYGTSVSQCETVLNQFAQPV